MIFRKPGTLLAIIIVSILVVLGIRYKQVKKTETVLAKDNRVIQTREEMKEPETFFYGAVVLDDFGYSDKNLSLLKELNLPVTMAVLPRLRYSSEVCEFALEHGFEVILHLPMQPENEYAVLEKDTISGDLDEAEVKRIFEQDFNSIINAKGLSNHMGSKATRDEKLMAIVFDQIKIRDAYFFDSFTSNRSVCAEIARDKGVPYLRRDIFLDNSRDKAEIKKRLKDFKELVFSRGNAIAIGHDRAETIEVLKEMIPEMKQNGIRFVLLGDLMKLKTNSSEKDNT
ncbi:MAG: divergent polysaccharide deacetylase family protein [Candidatus Omnitrophota bacterium]